MKFKIRAQNIQNDVKEFWYDNQENILSTEDGVIYEFPNHKEIQVDEKPFVSFSKDKPLKKSNAISLLKIQMGLSCNYSCNYCSQRFVERPPETSKKHIEAFMQKLESLDFSGSSGLKVEFWGGEPFVYWKTMKPLAEAIMEKYKDKINLRLSTVTNGSLLTQEICDWLVDMNFSIGLSHDGPGQSVRGEDPFDNPELKKLILDLFKRLPSKTSFNCVLNSKNTSRLKVFDYFKELTGNPNITLGEGAIVDAYDEGGYESSLSTKKEHFDFRKQAFAEIYETDGNIGFYLMKKKIQDFIYSLLLHKKDTTLSQKCGMDNENTLAIDLLGNVITCQNVSAASVAGNGESHKVGNIENMKDVAIKTATHWSNRPDCASCPVLHLCKGSCMYLEGKYWDISCSNSYSDNIVYFALAVEKITNGYIPTFIDAPHLPPERQDIFGRVLAHKESIKAKTISIKAI